MDHCFRRTRVLQRNLRVLNQKEDGDLQQKLNTLDKQYRYTRRTLQRRRDSLTNEHRRVVRTKVVEPKATVDIAMKEMERERSGGRAESVSARRRGNTQSSLSLRQMKNIAAIDSVSEKELARKQQKAREEMERLRQLQRETLHKRVAAFVETLRDKSNVETDVKPP